MQTVAGKKKDQKSGKTKKKNPKTKKLSSRRSKSSLTQGCGDLSTKILASMEKHKEVNGIIFLDIYTKTRNSRKGKKQDSVKVSDSVT